MTSEKENHLPLMQEVGLISHNIEKLLINTKKKGISNFTLPFLQNRLDKLNDYWDAANKNHAKILSLLSDGDRDNYPYFQNSVFEKTESNFECAEDFITDNMNLLHQSVLEIHQSTSTPTTATPPNNQSANNAPNLQVKLPRLDIPKFAGDYSEWTNFRDIFETVIHNNASLSNIQKFQYLKLSLTGEASMVVSALSLTNANYTSAWTALLNRFDNKRIIVTTLLQRLLTIRSVNADRLDELKFLRNEFSMVLESLGNIAVDTTNWDPLLIQIMSQKLDSVLRQSWEETLAGSVSLPTLAEFTQFLDTRIRTMEAIQCNNSTASKSNTRRTRLNFNVTKSGSSRAEITCAYCNGTHAIRHCSQFIALNVDERQRFTRQSNMCLNCLIKGHSVSDCKSRFSCRECGRRHHSLLHRQPESTRIQNANTATVTAATSISDSASSSENNTNVNVHMNSARVSTVLLATAIVRVISRNGHSLQCRALIDQGSEASFISETLAQNLRLTRSKANITVSGLGDESTTRIKQFTTFDVAPYFDSGVSLHVRAFVLQNITSYKPSAFSRPEPGLLGDLTLADPFTGRFDQIDLLLGADLYGKIIQNGLKKYPGTTLVAQDSIFGWILSGAVQSTPSRLITVNHATMDNLDEALQAFWTLEEIPTAQFETEEEKQCENYFRDTTYRDESGRFVVRLPFKSKEARDSLGNSKYRALKFLSKLSVKLFKNEKLNQKYSEFLQEYLELGHMSLVDDDSKVRVYLPHHGVLREDKLTTKLRVVFNASSPTESGVSLNDVLCIGPKLQTDITGVIFNWRLHRFVLNADIEKMFRQILIHPNDRRFQCILWRDSVSSQPRTYELNTVTYGTGPAPFLSMRVIRELASHARDSFPLAEGILTHNIYVDDVLFGADDKPLLNEMKQQVIDALASGGFTLKKWTSNSIDLLSPAEKLEFSELLKDEEQVKVKLLGLTWSPEEDSLILGMTLSTFDVKTKRDMLSHIAKLYDPMGWMSPLIIRAKCLIQSLWVLKIDWDSKLPHMILDQWSNFVQDASEFQQFSIPRWLGYGDHTLKLELIGFSDASTCAYSAVVYSRVTDVSGQIHVSLLMAKSKVAPLKTISIPRLELCGAVLLKNLLIHIQSLLTTKAEAIHCFTDSKIVLAWLAKPPTQWTTFVCNRVSNIQTSIPEARWRHVRSKENPADLNSRGVSASELKTSNLWWVGPSWLTSERFPTDESNDDWFDTNEEQRSSVMVASTETNPLWDYFLPRYSSWPKLLRVMAYVIRFLERLRSKNNGQITLSLSQEEIKRSKILIVKELQRRHYSPEIKAISQGRTLDFNSKLRNLNPFLDDDSVLRVGGRISNIPLKNRPIILPSCEVTQNLIRHFHLASLHGGLQLTLRSVRAQYWIINARNSTKSVIGKCIECIRQRGETLTQYMGDLPPARYNPSRPFTHTGLDYCGPFSIRTSPGRGQKALKGWIALFVCLATKAIHVEVVSSYSTSSFLASLDRFIARRGLPSIIYSDNGTTFQGANSEIRRAFRNVTRDDNLHNQYAVKGLEWRFIPPHAPHFGGLWEANIKSLKYHLKRVMRNYTPTFEELSTVTAQIEACLNSRPIAPLYDDPETFEVLTPGHFLIGTALNAPPTINALTYAGDLRTRWRQWAALSESIWKVWKSDYLNSLQIRKKWLKATDGPKPGDLVLLKSPNTPPCRWNLARVIETYPGPDGRVRVVKLKTSDTTLTRPITKVCPLLSSE